MATNRERQAKRRAKLRKMGISDITVTCWLKDRRRLKDLARYWLENPEAERTKGLGE